ncbi:hypothetical protein L2E82_20430 [Cichorium intybus]|uniref:Uncharacterized protein n=1 Tax=Cichorium intybus TaxID=13427 RepID=A0ACB9DSX1_CICIN|nr:hypothetical protein L2E82_20430 [Cichorium intybus]
MAQNQSTVSPPLAEPLANPDPDSIAVDKWVAGEDPILQVLNCVYPTLDSEEKRNDVIEYMQKLIRSSVGVEVFPYGSVPLKTYLPDGDIDFTAIGTPETGNTLPRDILELLQAEEQFGNNEFEVKDVTFIDAEVKLVKCIVSGIVIDISFNQLGGLCTLCFLEQIDRHIGNDHIFKRSIILIKTWCYYESRILGACYALISTYALEVLVLYIFHVFGASLTSPLMALYRFLDYYGKFDWDNYCISLDGPVNKTSLPNIVVENPVNRKNGALISEEFMKKCVDMFTVRPKGSETNVPPFLWKHLNIIDPLKETNNLGRSVHIGNFFRIMYAFRYGARTLGKVLELPNEDIGDGIKNFFVNTLKRHQSRYNIPDVPLTFDTLSLSSSNKDVYEDDVDSKLSNDSDFDDYISGMDDISNVGSGEASDLSAFQELSIGTTDEVADEGGDHDDDDDVSDDFFEVKNQDVMSGGFGETESLNPFAGLTGDYESSVRSLLYGQCYLGYALNGALVEANPAPFSGQGGVPREVAVFVPSAWFHHSPPSAPVNQNVVITRYEPYVNGQTTTQVVQHFQLEARNMARGTAPYIPVTNYSTGGGIGRGSGPPLPHRQQDRGHGRPGPLRQGYSQRKLVFGTLGSLLATGSSSGSGSGSQGSSSNVSCGFSQGSVQVDNGYLKNEDEFPPLAA